MISDKETSDYTTASQARNRKELRERASWLSGILKNSSDLLLTVDTEQCIIAFNDACEHYFFEGFGISVQTGARIEEIFSTIPDFLEPLLSANSQAFQGHAGSFSWGGIHSTGFPNQLHFDFNPINDSLGDSQGVVHIAKEIKKAQPVSDSDEEFVLLANAMPQFVWTSWMDGRNDFINEVISDYTGIETDELIKAGWQSCAHPDDLSHFNNQLNSFQKTGKSFETELRLRNKEGYYRWYISRVVPVQKNNVEVEKYLCTATDVHEQKILLDKLEQKAKELQLITEAIPQLVWTTEANGTHSYFNRRWYEFTGLNVQESFKNGWDRALHPEDYDRTIKSWQYSLNSGQPYHIEYRIRRHDGTYRWFIGRAVPLRNKDGEIIRWFGSCTDIHDQKLQRDELDEKNQKLFQINRYLDEFVHAVAHDLRSPVAGLKLSFDLLNQVDESKRDKIVHGCQTYLDRLDNTLKGLVQLIEIQEDPTRSHIEEVDLHQVLDQVLSDLQEKLQLAAASVKYGSFNWRTIRYPKPYLYNIVRNIIRYALRFRNPDEALNFKVDSRQENGCMVIRIRDNGPGINLEKELKNLFKPFSHINKGSDRQGMGLAIVKHMVEKNGGRIDVRSILGKGTEFEIHLKEYNIKE